MEITTLITNPLNIHQLANDPKAARHTPAKGGGTRMVKQAVLESLQTGRGGKVVLEARDEAVAFYENLGFVKGTGAFMILTPAKAAELMGKGRAIRGQDSPLAKDLDSRAEAGMTAAAGGEARTPMRLSGISAEQRAHAVSFAVKTVASDPVLLRRALNRPEQFEAFRERLIQHLAENGPAVASLKEPSFTKEQLEESMTGADDPVAPAARARVMEAFKDKPTARRLAVEAIYRLDPHTFRGTLACEAATMVSNKMLSAFNEGKNVVENWTFEVGAGNHWFNKRGKIIIDHTWKQFLDPRGDGAEYSAEVLAAEPNVFVGTESELEDMLRNLLTRKKRPAPKPGATPPDLAKELRALLRWWKEAVYVPPKPSLGLSSGPKA
jgi:hypothetical protein